MAAIRFSGTSNVIFDHVNGCWRREAAERMANIHERSPLLTVDGIDRRHSRLTRQDAEALSHASVEEVKMSDTAVGERLPYNNYTTIDQLHDLVKDSQRLQFLHSRKGFRNRALRYFDAASGWIAAAIIGSLTACVAFLVDISVATVSDWKTGYCSSNPLLNREACCKGKTSFTANDILDQDPQTTCPEFKIWTTTFASSYAIYVAFALVFGIISASVTMLTKSSLPAASSSSSTMDEHGNSKGQSTRVDNGKSIFMAAGSGIPEVKTILSGFVIPNYLDFKVLVCKAVGAIFAVPTGMCLGKEGPFVHISTCVGYLVAKQFPKYRDNGRKMREMLSAACASGLSVAFGAPIGGVLFSYEEISTYFPRKVLWRAFLCSLCAAVVLKALNPTGTGKLVLFETNYGTSYDPVHYAVFVVLGIAGGLWGGAFCRLNFYWSKWFRSFWIIKSYPIVEAFLIVLVTTLLQFPNPMTRVIGDETIRNLLVDCRNDASSHSWVCQSEAAGGWKYNGLLLYGTLVKLILTIITFGVKVPSGVIIPALDGGAFFGRLIGQWVPDISPGIFAMVGAGAFLAGVSRMTISLVVIMFELTGELEYIPPNMIAILVAKWVADGISKEGVYDVAQAVLGHPFMDIDESVRIVQRQSRLIEELIPPDQTMREITVMVPLNNKVPRGVLEKKLEQLKSRGLLDAGLVLVDKDGMLQGYLAQAELEFGLDELGRGYAKDSEVRLLGDAADDEYDLGYFVDRTPLSVCEKAPLEYAVEMFGKLGLRHLMVTEEGTGTLVGVIIKKRLVAYLEELENE